MKLTEAIASVLGDFPEGLAASEIALIVAKNFPELLETPGRRNGRGRLTSLDLLSAAINDAGSKYPKRFRQDKSTVPQRIALAGSDDRLWTDEELRESVDAYLAMRRHELAGQKYVKTEIYRALAAKIDRPTKSIERRMQNISAVFSRQGRRWIKGLLPAKHVGENVARRIAEIIAETEGSPLQPFEIAASAPKVSHATPPKGQTVPRKEQAVTVKYARDAAVKEWVLQFAKGRCECCCQPAPFESLQGPFLEVHHVRRLSDEGEDTIHNAVALCPNCHRWLHYGLDAPQRIDDLYLRVERLTR